MIDFKANELHVSGSVFTLDFPIQDVREVSGKIVVLFRPDAATGLGQFRNLVAYDPQGLKIWEAELPTNSSMDAYYQLVPDVSLVADSICSYRCHLDPTTGRIISKEFFK